LEVQHEDSLKQILQRETWNHEVPTEQDLRITKQLNCLDDVSCDTI